MVAKITVSDENGIVFGEVRIDHTYVGEYPHHTIELIGEEVVNLLPGGIKFLKDDGKNSLAKRVEEQIFKIEDLGKQKRKNK